MLRGTTKPPATLAACLTLTLVERAGTSAMTLVFRQTAPKST